MAMRFRKTYLVLKNEPGFPRNINEYMMYISGVTYYISSTINPILYNVMSAKYRQDTVIVYYAYEIPVHGRSQENPITHFFYNTTTILF